MLVSMVAVTYTIFKFLLFTLLDCIVAGLILAFIVLVIDFVRYYVTSRKEKRD